MKEFTVVKIELGVIESENKNLAFDSYIDGKTKWGNESVEFFKTSDPFWSNLTIEDVSELRKDIEILEDINQINIDNENWYCNNENQKRTRRRLLELNYLGCKEVGIAQFGIDKVFSGLYIESVWKYSESQWDDYVKWIEELKIKQ